MAPKHCFGAALLIKPLGSRKPAQRSGSVILRPSRQAYARTLGLAKGISITPMQSRDGFPTPLHRTRCVPHELLKTATHTLSQVKAARTPLRQARFP